LRQTFF